MYIPDISYNNVYTVLSEFIHLFYPVFMLLDSSLFFFPPHSIQSLRFHSLPTLQYLPKAVFIQDFTFLLPLPLCLSSLNFLFHFPVTPLNFLPQDFAFLFLKNFSHTSNLCHALLPSSSSPACLSHISLEFLMSVFHLIYHHHASLS